MVCNRLKNLWTFHWQVYWSGVRWYSGQELGGRKSQIVCFGLLMFVYFYLLFFSRLKTRKGEDGCRWKKSHNCVNWSVRKGFFNYFCGTVLNVKSSCSFSTGTSCLVCQLGSFVFYQTIPHFMYHFCLIQNLENYTVLVVEATDNWDMATVRYVIVCLFLHLTCQSFHWGIFITVWYV